MNVDTEVADVFRKQVQKWRPSCRWSSDHRRSFLQIRNVLSFRVRGLTYSIVNIFHWSTIQHILPPKKRRREDTEDVCSINGHKWKLLSMSLYFSTGDKLWLPKTRRKIEPPEASLIVPIPVTRFSVCTVQCIRSYNSLLFGLTLASLHSRSI